MAEYLERESLIAWLHNMEASPALIKAIENKERFPAADVVEVVHAYWNKDPVTGVKLCSNCKAPPPGDAELEEFYESDLCPGCGAKMEVSGNENV